MGVRRMRSQEPMASSKKVRFSSMRMRGSSSILDCRHTSAGTRSAGCSWVGYREKVSGRTACKAPNGGQAIHVSPFCREATHPARTCQHLDDKVGTVSGSQQRPQLLWREDALRRGGRQCVQHVHHWPHSAFMVWGGQECMHNSTFQLCAPLAMPAHTLTHAPRAPDH